MIREGRFQCFVNDLLRFSVLVPLIGGLMVIAFSALPSRHGLCLPALQLHRSSQCELLRAVCAVHADAKKTKPAASTSGQLKPDGQGKRAIKLTAAELAKLPDVAEDRALHRGRSTQERLHYALQVGYQAQYQINVGPDSESKVYVINFTGCPAR